MPSRRFVLRPRTIRHTRIRPLDRDGANGKGAGPVDSPSANLIVFPAIDPALINTEPFAPSQGRGGEVIKTGAN